MKILDFISKIEGKVLTNEACIEKEILTAYSCDLLSWVMAHGKNACAWITIQTHLNVIAVAALLDIPCIIIPENCSIEKTIADKAETEGIVLITTLKTSFEICGILYSLLMQEETHEDCD